MALGHLNWGSVASRSQRVVAFNSSTVQTRVLINRYGHGETLLPGERREVELNVGYIENLRRQRDPTRIDELGRLKPLHPVLLIDVPPQNVIHTSSKKNIYRCHAGHSQRPLLSVGCIPRPARKIVAAQKEG
jgi:hypothetical protein